MKKIFTTLFLALIPFFVMAQTISLPFSYDGGQKDLPEGVIQDKLGSDYKSHPETKLRFDKKGSSLTFHLPSHQGLTFWYNYRENGNVTSNTFHVQISTDPKHKIFSDVTPTLLQTNRYVVSIPAGVTAVKLLYNKKKTGNIGIGGLHIEEVVPFTITSAGYATFYANKNVRFPQGVKASIVEADGNGIKVKELAEQVVNANTAVLLQAKAGAYVAEPLETAEGTANTTGNILQGCLEEKDVTATAGQKIYILNKGSKGVGFYWEMGTGGNSATVQAGHAYLSLPISGGAAQGFSLDTPTVTGVEAVETIPSEDAPIYDLSGRRVMTPTHGIYIVGGKKVLK